jgi:hypothetical protein
MISKRPRVDRSEQRATLILCTAFASMALVAVAVLLRCYGYEWFPSPPAAVTGEGIAASPYFALPRPVRTPWVPAPEPISDVTPALPPKPPTVPTRRSGRTLRGAVEAYLESMHAVEIRKRALLKALAQASPNVRTLLEQKPNTPGEKEIAERAVANDERGGSAVAGSPLKFLPSDEWDQLIDTQAQTVPPEGCDAIHAEYSAHLQSLRELTLGLLAAGRTPAAAGAPASPSAQQPADGVRASTRLADAALSGLCGQFGVRKEFDVALDDK